MQGNGGIASWTKKYLKTFPDQEFKVYPVAESKIFKQGKKSSKLRRIISGIQDVLYIKKQLNDLIKYEIKADILHITTSASLGTYRDNIVGKFCKKHGIKSVLHYRYGNLPNDLATDGRYKRLLLETMQLYDNIWVLDRKTFNILTEYSQLKGKVKLTPNSIEVIDIGEIRPKDYNKYLFMANIYPTKGIFELVKAIRNVKEDLCLKIAGPSTKEILDTIREESGNLWGNKIEYLGKFPNDQAVELLKSMDCLVLPTYYRGEAFPISILEAMSYGKLVISTPRAAIPDMLTAEDGSQCGILVDEKSVSQLTDAISWCINHKSEADEMCHKAYNKVKHSYSTDVVYQIYRDNYRALLK